MQDFALLATAIGLGASGVRVGFEDSVQYAPGKIAEKNVDLVAKIVSLVHRIGYEVAAPNEARNILGVIRK
jgi:3-keto-5-aminohexanoate cleavage enzyme